MITSAAREVQSWQKPLQILSRMLLPQATGTCDYLKLARGLVMSQPCADDRLGTTGLGMNDAQVLTTRPFVEDLSRTHLSDNGIAIVSQH